MLLAQLVDQIESIDHDSSTINTVWTVFCFYFSVALLSFNDLTVIFRKFWHRKTMSESCLLPCCRRSFSFVQKRRMNRKIPTGLDKNWHFHYIYCIVCRFPNHFDNYLHKMLSSISVQHKMLSITFIYLLFNYLQLFSFIN